MSSEEKVITQRQNGGRPPKPIDWEKVDRCLESGCSGVQTASYIGVHAETLYDACVREKEMSFTDYSSKKSQKGESMIAMKQFQEAMKGDRGMLIWLGKQRLKQRDSKDSRIELENPQIGIINFGSNPNPRPYQPDQEAASSE